MAFPAPSTILHSPTTSTLALTTAYTGTWLQVRSPGQLSVSLDDAAIGFTVKMQIGEDGDATTYPMKASGEWWRDFPRGTLVFIDVLAASGTPNASISVGG